MQHAVTVGMGFGKHKFDEAITSSKAGDVILVDPGEYHFPKGFSINNIEIRGTGKSPSDVTVHTYFTVKPNGIIKLENITLINEIPDQNTCYVNPKGQLIAKRVLFSSNGQDDYPVVAVHGGNAGFTACEMRHKEEKGLGVFVSNSGYALISHCDVTSLKAVTSQVEVQESQIRRFLMIRDNAELTADSLYLAEPLPDWFLTTVLNGSSLTTGKLHVPEGQIAARVVGSRFSAPQTNIDPLHTLMIQSEEASDIDVTNAEVQEVQKQQSNPEEKKSDDPSDTQPETDPTPTEEKPAEVKAPEKPAIEQLHDMIGLTDLKKQVDSFIKLAAFTKKRAEQGEKTSAQSLHSLFLGNPGTGKTTVARLVAKAMFENGVMPKDNYVEVSRQDLVSDNVGGTAMKTQKVLESALGGVLFVDEAYSLYQAGGVTNWGQEAVDTILKYMEDHRNDLMIIFAGYTKEMKDFMNMNPGLTSRAPNVFNFEDYTPDEISQIGILELKDQQFKFDEDYYSQAVIKSFKGDLDHSNGRWVRNFNDQLIRVVAMNAMDNDDHDLNTILNSDIDELTGGNSDSKAAEVDRLLEQLNGMIGLRNVKDYVADLVERIRVEQKLEDRLPGDSHPTYHMVFAGAPGTGKTTVARIIAKLFYNLGILPKDTVSEVSRPDLVAGYIGQTEAKTETAIRNAMGGVLFVDEAYQLTQGTDNDFGKQAVETFITELENNRDKFVAIFAGYTDEMNHFLEANPGLRSRIPITLKFDPYTPDEVAEIVVAIVEKDWQVNEVLLKSVVTKLYKELPEEDQSNGRWARNFSDKLIAQHKLWLSEHSDVTDVTHISDDLLFDSMAWNQNQFAY